MSLSFSSSMCFTCFWKIATSYWRPHKRYIFTFSHSAKRSEYEKFQHFAQTEPRKLLKPAQTRWLSLEQCIQRIIEQWPALELYFEKPAKNDRLISSQNIFTALKNPIFKLYFYFLSFILRKFTNFNKLFQSKTPNIHFLTNYLASTYKAFLSCYLLSTYIRSTSLHCIDPASPSNLLPLTSMNMGEKSLISSHNPISLSWEMKFEDS